MIGARANGGRVAAYDYLRVFAMLAVVAIHIFRVYRPVLSATSVPMLLDDVIHFAVPVFFFAAGAVVWGRPWSGGHGAWLAFMRRRIPSLLLPYLAWTVGYLALDVAQRGPQALAPLTVASAFLLGTGWYHLYFVPTLIVFYALTPAAAWISRRSPEVLLALGFAARIVLMPRLVDPGLALSDPVRGFLTHLAVHAPDIALGTWFALRSRAMVPLVRRTWPVALPLATALVWLREAGALPPLAGMARSAAFTLTMALMLLGLAGLGFFAAEKLPRLQPRVDRLAALSLGVYLVHPAIVEALLAVAGPPRDGSLWIAPGFGLLAYAVVLAGSLGVSGFLRSRPETSWLVGEAGRGKTNAGVGAQR